MHLQRPVRDVVGCSGFAATRISEGPACSLFAHTDTVLGVCSSHFAFAPCSCIATVGRDSLVFSNEPPCHVIEKGSSSLFLPVTSRCKSRLGVAGSLGFAVHHRSACGLAKANIVGNETLRFLRPYCIVFCTSLWPCSCGVSLARWG